MSLPQFISKLQDTATLLEAFIEPVQSGGLVWDGNEYVQSSNGAFDPYALSWWGILRTVADLLKTQSCPITPEQHEYLDKVLFGGMGSFNDFALDVDEAGETGRDTNEKLEIARQEMFDIFKELQS